jgi:hypothetical protein
MRTRPVFVYVGNYTNMYSMNIRSPPMTTNTVYKWIGARMYVAGYSYFTKR